MSRLVKGYASAYRADQVQVCKVRRQQKRRVHVDFNGTLGVSDFITSVRWDCNAPWITAISDARVETGQKAVSVLVDFNYGGFGNLKATATISDGLSADTQQNYEFEFTVTDAPMYPNAVYPAASNTYSLTAEFTP